MKLLNSALCAIIFGLVLILSNPVSSRSAHLLGAKECTWGPSYWCSNITNAKSCGAVRHCIQTVWEKQTVPEDNDSICKICLDMVKQARDQLESNETQNDLKAVFEGSCKLIPIKPVQKECVKLADNFIPELVEALASQMNPQVVCSVAGLCNNAAIDKMLSELPVSTMQHEAIEPSTETTIVTVNNKKQLSCSGCNNVATIIANKFHSSNQDEILENLLHVCGRLSSFSDSCSNIVLTYFGDIYDELSETLNAESICHMSGVCSAKYHSHPEIVEIRPMSNVGVVPVKEDIPCELCEQLVGHLRDLLVANTTESEFKQVLEGLCKQTKGFTKECLNIVDQYYDEIYKALVNNLDANGACFLIGVCPKGLGSLSDLVDNHPIMPILPAFPPAKIDVNIKELPQKKKLLGENEPKFTNEQINSMQLPIDKLMGAPHANELIENGQSCTLCEYFCHFLQEALASPANEDKIKNIVGTTCDKFPTSLRAECHNFINTYGDAVIALLIQEIDPREICPAMKLCPKDSFNEDMEVFAPRPIDVAITQSETPSCPLCLFAVTQAEQMIKEDRTTERVKHVLDSLCGYVPKKLQAECIDFVDTYSTELIQMLVNDLPPQKICVEIKLCTENPPGLTDVNISVDNDDDTMTNEIPDNTINGSPVYEIVNGGPECYLCKRIVGEALKHIVNNKSKAHIRDELERACEKIHQIKNKCRSYIDKYGDKIIDLIMQELSAKEICAELMLCSSHDIEDLEIDEALKIDIIAIPSDANGVVHLNKMVKYDDSLDSKDAPCALCEFVMVKLEQELKDKKTQDEIKNTIHSICKKMPKTISNSCNKFVDQYGDMVLDLLETVPPKEICQKLQLCFMLAAHVHDEIIDCGVCHGTVTALVPLIHENYNVQYQEMIEEACENLPAKYYGKCSDLIAYYGESILNLVKANTEQSEICAKIGKCFKEEHSINSYLRIGGGVENSGVSNVRQRRSNDDDNKMQLVGSDKCSWGPAHWCENKENADKCSAHSWCVEKKMGYAATE